jgi:hypothetical protein
MATFSSSQQASDLPPPFRTFKTFYARDQTDAPYDEIQVTTQYTYDTGKRPLHVAARPGSRVKRKIVQLWAPESDMVVRCLSVRRAAKPKLPRPKDLTGATFAFFAITRPLDQVLGEGGSFIYQVEATYTYWLDYPLDLENLKLPSASSGVAQFDPNDHDFMAVDFDDGMLPSF